VERLFLTAVELPASERESFLTTQCGGDDALRNEVWSLLRCDTSGDVTLAEAVRSEAVGAVAEEPREGRMLGAWRIEREIGRGGMSVVYLGSRADGEFRKSVALKVIRHGMDTDAVIARMRQERGILASLDHPGISRLLDGGTTPDGLPWIAMEYVDGVPIDAWCEQSGWDIAQRCELMIRVCEAVAYAHRNLIVHGDIKPGNILVGKDGSPRLLDFGIAKLLRFDENEASAVGPLTRGLMRPFTPEYASPEQLSGSPIGTATDVYSLGVVLYELLTGVRPRAGAPPASSEALRAGKGGRWSARLRGDLDNILNMALRVEPERRYLSVDGLALDLKRYIGGLPVAARPDTLRYRTSKFVRRNRFGVAAAAAILLALTGGIVVSEWEAGRARLAQQAALGESARARTERDRAVAAEKAADRERSAAVAERERANKEAETAKAVTDFLRNDLLGQASPNAQAGQDLKVRTALDRAALSVEGKFAGKPLVEADIRDTIGDSYDALGLYAEAQQQYQRVWELRRGALGEKHRDTLDALTSVAVLERKLGKLDEAERLNQRILTVQRVEFGERDKATLLTMNNLAVVYAHQGKYEQSAVLNRKILAIEKAVLGPEHLDTLRTMNNLGVNYSQLGRFAEAERLYRDVLQIRRRVQGPEHPNTIFTANNLAVVYSRPGGNPELAESLYIETLEVQRKILGPEHPDTLLTMDNLGILWLTQAEKYAAAEQILTETAAARARVLGPKHADTLETRVWLGVVTLAEGKYREAEDELRPTCGTYAEVKQQAWQRYACGAWLGESLVGQKRYAEAEPLLLEGYADLKAREASMPSSARGNIERVARWLVRLYDEQGKTEEAAQWKRISESSAAPATH
jgi:tetratricopeptide (TPR) repeat protein/tRNA A-37 threonylcarbamoyl transferase component Bud32